MNTGSVHLQLTDSAAVQPDNPEGVIAVEYIRELMIHKAETVSRAATLSWVGVLPEGNHQFTIKMKASNGTKVTVGNGITPKLIVTQLD